MMARHGRRIEARRKWISGLAITLCTIVAYLAFWRLSPVPTFVVGVLSLVGIVVAMWIAGGTTEDRPED